jgi:hypothetical protein
LRGVVLVTPLRMTKNMRRMEPAMRMRDTKPKVPPVEVSRKLWSAISLENSQTYALLLPWWMRGVVEVEVEVESKVETFALVEVGKRGS